MFVFFMSLPFVKGDLVYKGLAGIFDHDVRFPGSEKTLRIKDLITLHRRVISPARQPLLVAGEHNGYYVCCFVLRGFLFIMEIR